MQIVIHRPESWTETLAQGLDIPLINNTIHIPKEKGQGRIRSISIEEGMHINIKEVYFHENVHILKKAWPESSLQAIIFHFSESGVSQMVNGERVQIGRDTPNSIVIPSAKIESRILIPAKSKVSVLAIIFKPEWLKRYFSHPNAEGSSLDLVNLFFGSRTYFIYETANPQMLRVMGEIIQAQYPPELLRVYFQAKILELLTLLFHKMQERKSLSSSSHINNQNIEQLLSAEKILIENIDKPLKISDLSKKVAMSESKLKKSFKEVFGYPIYQYILRYRMEKAKMLLDTQRFNVSEVGTTLGYSNLAHFAKAFKKHFNTSPGMYLNSLKSD